MITEEKKEMLRQQTLQKLRGMKLLGMAEAFSRQLEQPALHDLSFEERLGLLVDEETTYRENRRLQRLLREAKLRDNACVEDIDYRHPRGLERSRLAALVSCDWVRAAHNLCITGPTGSGKTWIGCALGQQACRQGLRVRYVRVPRLLEDLKKAHGDGSFRQRLVQLSRIDLLILDDWGIKQMGQSERHDMMEVIEERHGLKSTLVTSQLPIENWHDYLGEPTLADAVLDRLLHNTHKLLLKGESMRRMKNRLTEGERKK
jgi:DNA replication protein DnaC